MLVTASVLVVKWDERRLDEEQLERAWSPASRDNALIGLALLGAPLLGLFAVWFHFTRTRSRRWPWLWNVKGFFLGLGAVALIMLTNMVVVITLAYALGLPLDE